MIAMHHRMADATRDVDMPGRASAITRSRRVTNTPRLASPVSTSSCAMCKRLRKAIGSLNGELTARQVCDAVIHLLIKWGFSTVTCRVYMAVRE